MAVGLDRITCLTLLLFILLSAYYGTSAKNSATY